MAVGASEPSYTIVAVFGVVVSPPVLPPVSPPVVPPVLPPVSPPLVAAAFTVTSTSAVFSPAFAVILTVPAATPVTLPVESTVAIAVSAEVHVTVLSVAFSGETVASRIIVSPAVNKRKAYAEGIRDDELINKTMDVRIEKILTLAVSKKPSVIILGAYGCGVFGNDREVIYSLFERHIRRIVPEGIRVAFAVI